ncbi:MAG: DUF4440 domain-containing protein [Acidobacteriota bacterium]|nr:DUF4440 domain-containing protein [Acidobacteriota bacterium]
MVADAAVTTDRERILEKAFMSGGATSFAMHRESQITSSDTQRPGFRITWTSTDVTFSPDSKLAYMFSRNAVTMNATDGTPTTTEGRAVTIWRREPDGEWRCAVEIWNAEPDAELQDERVTLKW